MSAERKPFLWALRTGMFAACTGLGIGFGFAASYMSFAFQAALACDVYCKRYNLTYDEIYQNYVQSPNAALCLELATSVPTIIAIGLYALNEYAGRNRATSESWAFYKPHNIVLS